MDYFERAKRQVGLPKIESFIAEEKVRSRELWDKMETERLAKMREEWKTSRETKNRLSAMNSDAEAFKNVLKVSGIMRQRIGLSHYYFRKNVEITIWSRKRHLTVKWRLNG